MFFTLLIYFEELMIQYFSRFEIVTIKPENICHLKGNFLIKNKNVIYVSKIYIKNNSIIISLYTSLYKSKMRRFLIFFKPIKILYFFPQIFFIIPLKFYFVLLSIWILKGIGSEDYSITILDNGFAGHKYFKCSIKSIMNSKLVAT